MCRYIPNLLTTLRIALTPVFVYLFLHRAPVPALIVFLLAQATDVLDGCIARRFGWITPLGKALDPLADKITLIGVLLCLRAAGRVPLWLAAPVIAREILMIISGLMLWNRRRTFAADAYGKITTLLFFASAVLLFPWHENALMIRIGGALMMASLVASVVASLHYLRLYLHAKHPV